MSKTRRNRGHNMGTLEMHGGRWMVRYFDETGRRVRISTGCDNKHDAEMWLNNWSAERLLATRIGDVEQRLGHVKAQLEAELRRDRSRLMSMRAVGLDKVMDAAFGDVEMSDDARRGHRRCLELFAGWMTTRHKYISTTDLVTVEIADEYRREGMVGRSQDWQWRCLKALRRAWSMMMRKGLVMSNPWRDVRVSQPRYHRKRMLTDAEVERVLEVVDTEGGEMRTLYYVGVYTGLRLGDCCTLRWADIRESDGCRYIDVVPSKTSRAGVRTTIPICGRLWDVLKDLDKGSDYVMPRFASMYKSGRVRVDRMVNAVIDRAGIKRRDETGRTVVGYHSLRHTLVSRLAIKGVPLTVVQSIVGHTREHMTEYYAHTTLAAQRDAMSRLD